MNDSATATTRHDFRTEACHWGWNVLDMHPISETQFEASFVGLGVENGHEVILSSFSGDHVYEVSDIRYYRDPSDMFKCRLTHKPTATDNPTPAVTCKQHKETNMTKALFTAEQARALSQRSVTDIVFRLLDYIEHEAAPNEERSVRAGLGYTQHRSYTQHPNLWNDCGLLQNDDWKAAKAQLESLGYKVSFVEYPKGTGYTLIEW